MAAITSPACLKKNDNLRALALSKIEAIVGLCQKKEPTEELLPESWDGDLFSPPKLSHDCRVAEFYSKPREEAELHDYPCLKQLFLNSNVPLTTSADVERLFSHGRRAMPWDRTRIGDDTFEASTILRVGIQ